MGDGVSCISLSDWSGKLTPLSKPIRRPTKTNRNLAALVFPRSRQFTCVNVMFPSALRDILLFFLILLVDNSVSCIL